MSGVTLNVLIDAALADKPYNQQRLGIEARRYARAITNRVCADFPEDRHDEVCQQAFVELLGLGASALREKSGRALFRRAIFSAIRVVRADYAPPGQRTRSAPGAAPPGRVAAEDIGRVADAKTIERCTIGTDAAATLDFDLLESEAAAAAIKQVEDRIDSEWSLRAAPEGVAVALRLICLDGEKIETAALSVGLDRFTFRRQVIAFRAKLQAAA